MAKGDALQQLIIKAPNFQVVEFTIEGTAPLVMNKFSEKAKHGMMDTMSKSSGAKGRGKRDPKDFDETLLGAIHFSTDGWVGFPCAGFRNAAVSACRIVGFKMTLAKMGIFIAPEGFDRDEGSPLVRILGEYRGVDHVVRLATGVASVTRRPMFDQWGAKIRCEYDGDMFSAGDLYNLFMRVGLQVGIGEGRPDSKNSTGMGWGTFRIIETREMPL